MITIVEDMMNIPWGSLKMDKLLEEAEKELEAEKEVEWVVDTIL